MAPDDSAARGPIPMGPVGRYLIENLKDLRSRRRLSYKDLSERLRQLGRPIPTLGLSRIERGDRRVDVDDLVALALALGVNPTALLLPRGAPPDQLVTLAGEDVQATARDAWAWADGERTLPSAGPGTRSSADITVLADFVTHARPWWTPLPPVLQAIGATRHQPIVAAIVTSPAGILVTKRRDGTPPWGFLTGEVEPGERPEDAAVREVKEEAGLLIIAGAVIGERDHPQTGRHMIYMACAPTNGLDVEVGDAAELEEVRWVSLAEADKLLPGMYQPVRAYLAEQVLDDGQDAS